MREEGKREGGEEREGEGRAGREGSGTPRKNPGYGPGVGGDLTSLVF